VGALKFTEKRGNTTTQTSAVKLENRCITKHTVLDSTQIEIKAQEWKGKGKV